MFEALGRLLTGSVLDAREGRGLRRCFFFFFFENRGGNGGC